MKKVVALHGTDGSPANCWFPWLSTVLTAAGNQVWFPDLPENHTPNRSLYENFLKNADWDFAQNTLIGHSSGATTILNLLQSDWFPAVDTIILAGVFLNERLLADIDWYEPGQFDGLFTEDFDVQKIKQKAKKFYFIHGDNDRYCSFEDARDFAEKLGATFISVAGGKHLSSNREDLPEVLPILKEEGVI